MCRWLQIGMLRVKLSGYFAVSGKEMRIIMEKCKFCQAELEENVTLCPACGKEQGEEIAPAEETAAAEAAAAGETAAAEQTAEEAPEEASAEEAAAEEAPAEEAEEKAQEAAPAEKPKASPAKITAAVVALVLVLALLIAAVANGTAAPGTPAETTVPTEASGEAAEPTDLTATEATLAADGNPDDVTCKGTYTADDETVIAAADNVVATMGEAELTVSQLQVYYWLEVTSFLNTLYNYGMDGSSLGIDYYQGLDYQRCSIDQTKTWQQFFLESALGSWQNYQALALAAADNGYEMDEEHRSQLDTMVESLDIQAQSYGMADGKELLAYNVGNCAEIEDYVHFLEINYQGGGYLDQVLAALEFTDEELEAFYAENEAAYLENGLTKELCSVDVRHILVFPEGADNSNIRTETFPEEAWAVGEKQANEILELWLAGDKTEESFAALANEHSADPGSNTAGGLYTDVMQGDMVEEFDAWCFDPARQVGDTAVVRTSLGFHVMYFSGSEVLWPTYVRQDMVSEKQQELLEEALATYGAEVTIDYSAILLGYLSLAG